MGLSKRVGRGLSGRRGFIAFLALATATSGLANPAGAQEPAADAASLPDLAIVGGLVMNPADRSESYRTVVVDDGSIVALVEGEVAAQRVIDASGKVVAPGFIDVHSHLHHDHLGGRIQAFDGVTTAWDSEAGIYPVDAAYRIAAREGRAINYAFAVGWAFGPRAMVMDHAHPEGTLESFARSAAGRNWPSRLADDEQLEQILDLTEQGLREGAVNIALMNGYAAGSGVKEVHALSQLARRYSVPVVTHVRYGRRPQEPDSTFQGFQEVIANAATTGAHWHISHTTSSAEGDFDRAMGLIAQAQAAGVPISTENLAWSLGATFANAAFYDPEYRQTVLGKTSPDDLYYAGRQIGSWDELVRIRASDPSGMIVNLRRDEDNNPADQAEMVKQLRFPGAILASDSMPIYEGPNRLARSDAWPIPEGSNTIPRSTATFTRAIDLYVNRLKAFSLMDVLVMGSHLPATIFGQAIPQLRAKGRIAVGADADLIVFDPAAVRANATIAQPTRQPSGMAWVIVNGVPLIEDGVLRLDILPGKPIRNPVTPEQTSAAASLGSAEGADR